MEQRPYVIIGASSASLGGIKGIRTVDPERPIVVVAREDEVFYPRPLITYWLSGKVGDEAMAPLDDAFFARNRVEVVRGTDAERLNAEENVVVTAEGRAIAYHRALIAGGGHPIVPPALRESDAEGCFTFTTWGDARRVKAWLESHDAPQAVVVGGGFIGVKVAEALAHLGVAVTVVELAERILAAALDPTATGMARAALERAGIHVRCGTSACGIESHCGRISGIVLEGGETLPCDLLVVAIGVQPDLALAQRSGIVTHKGICVDHHLQTSEPGIYAAGDVVEAADSLGTAPRPIPILPNARRQGYVAGCNMAGAHRVFRGGTARNAITLCGFSSVSIGLGTAEGEGFDVCTAHEPEHGAYRRLVFQDDRLVGAVLVETLGRAGVLAHLVKQRINVANCKHRLLEPQFPLDILPPDYWRRGVGMEAEHR